MGMCFLIYGSRLGGILSLLLLKFGKAYPNLYVLGPAKKSSVEFAHLPKFLKSNLEVDI